MEVHESVCRNHIGARALAGKVLRQGYYWPTILRDATDLVRRCKIFQEHTKISRLPSEPLTSITSPWHFQYWGLDILGPLPIGKGQCKFIIVAVDYFTKWDEAEPLATITEQRYAILCGEPLYAGLVSHEPWYPTMESNLITPSSGIFVPSLKLRIITLPQHIHSQMVKQRSPSEPLRPH